MGNKTSLVSSSSKSMDTAGMDGLDGGGTTGGFAFLSLAAAAGAFSSFIAVVSFFG